MLAAFAWPATNIAPRDLPIGLAAPDPVAAQIEKGLASGAADALEVTRVADRAEAERLIRDREIYGAIVVDADGAAVLTASAASPVVAQLLGQLATNWVRLSASSPRSSTSSHFLRTTRAALGWPPLLCRWWSAGWRPQDC